VDRPVAGVSKRCEESPHRLGPAIDFTLVVSAGWSRTSINDPSDGRISAVRRYAHRLGQCRPDTAASSSGGTAW
jgi:hypothetical protein